MNKRIKKKVRRRGRYRGRGRMLAISDISIYENVESVPYMYETRPYMDHDSFGILERRKEYE